MLFLSKVILYTYQNKSKFLKWLGSSILRRINITSGTTGIFAELPLDLILSSRSNMWAVVGSEIGLSKKMPNAHRIRVCLLTVKNRHSIDL